MLKKKHRIHVIPVGLQSDWIIRTVKNYRADKVYLITCPDGKKKQEAEKNLKRLLSELRKMKIQSEEIICNTEDFNEIIAKIKPIFEKEKENDLYISLASGKRELTMPLTIMAMFFKGINQSIQCYLMNEIDVQTVPTFEVRLPREDLIKVLKFIAEKETGRSKKEIVEYVNPKVESRLGKNKQASRYMKVQRNILEKLQFEWGLTENEGFRKSSKVKLTEKGREFMKFL